MRWETGRAIARSGLPPSSRLVLIMLVEHINQGGEAFPGQDVLAEETGYSERQVRTCLSELEAAGFVRRLRGGVGRGQAVVYGVDLPGVPGAKGGSKGGGKGEQASAFRGRKEEVKEEVRRNERGNVIPLFGPESPVVGPESPNGQGGELVNYRELDRGIEGTTPPLTPPPSTEARNWSEARLRDFLAAYPQTVDIPSPSRLRPLWRVACGGPDDFAAIMLGLEGWKVSETWTKEGGRFICGPEKFLAEQRWQAIPAKRKEWNNLNERNAAVAQRLADYKPGASWGIDASGIFTGDAHPGGGVRPGEAGPGDGGRLPPGREGLRR